MAEEKGLTYTKDGGVSIEEGNKASDLAKGYAKKTQEGHDEVVVQPGLFSGAVSIEHVIGQYKNPVIVQVISGVDEALEQRAASGDFVGTGKELFERLLANLGENVTPLFSSDYYASGKTNPQHIGEFVRGFAIGNKKAKIPLIAGENAEMPDVYNEGRLELVGAIIGIAEKGSVQANESRGVFELNVSKYKKPVLVHSFDGAGTKTMIGVMMNNGRTIFYDVGNHSANDLLMQGAKPLFISSFVGRHGDDGFLEQIQQGIDQYTTDTGITVIAQDVKTKPGTYQKGQYDVVASITGIVERDGIIDGSTIEAGDYVLALPSNGLHTNGYSLVRRIVFEKLCLTVDDYVEELGCTLGDELLRPHREYVNIVQDLIKRGIKIKGMTHNTGGGLIDNPIRVLSDNLAISFDKRGWHETPAIFRYLQEKGPVEQREMYRTFNCGLGMLLYLDERNAVKALDYLKNDAFIAGKVTDRVTF